MDYDLHDSFNDYAGQNIAIGSLMASRQRGQQLEQQREQLTLLEKQNHIESSRLQIEELRLQAEQQERELKREQLEQIKHLRNLLADTVSLLRTVQKQHP